MAPPRGDPPSRGGGDRLDARVPAPSSSGVGALDLRLRLSGVGRSGQSSDLIAIVGASQMGKTRGAIALLRGCRNLVVVDVTGKGQYDGLPGAVVTEEPDDVCYHPVVVWKIAPAHVRRWSKDWSDPFSTGLRHIREVRARAGVTVVLDEARMTLPTDPHPWAAELIDNGMGRGIGCLVISQGSDRVYPPALHNARVWLMFRLQSATMRGTLARSLEVNMPDLGRLKPLTFFAWRQGWSEPRGPFPLSELGRAGRRTLTPTNGLRASSDGAPTGVAQAHLTTPGEL